MIEHSKVIYNAFNVKGRISVGKETGTHIVSYSRKTLASFFYHCLGICKSDEDTRIPYWIWNSPKSVITEYLRYAYAMEGSVDHYLKGAEIKFHSVSSPYLEDLKKILKEKFEIKFFQEITNYIFTNLRISNKIFWDPIYFIEKKGVDFISIK